MSEFLSSQDAYAVYTDGSKMLNSDFVGEACVCPKLNVEIKKTIANNASVYTAESIAISNALDIALDNSDCNFLIFTDSLSILSSLKSTKFKIKTNPHILEIKKKYNQFHYNNENRYIQFFWTPSHIGIQGNETADTLAKEATKGQVSEPLTIPFTDYHETFKRSAKEQTNLNIKEQFLIKGKTYFETCYNESAKP